MEEVKFSLQVRCPEAYRPGLRNRISSTKKKWEFLYIFWSMKLFALKHALYCKGSDRSNRKFVDHPASLNGNKKNHTTAGASGIITEIL